jgi:hypothetical protein
MLLFAQLFVKKPSTNIHFKGSEDTEDFESGSIIEGTWRASGQSASLQTSHSRNSPATAKAVRDSYCDFFYNERQVSWQHKFA